LASLSFYNFFVLQLLIGERQIAARPRLLGQALPHCVPPSIPKQAISLPSSPMRTTSWTRCAAPP